MTKELARNELLERLWKLENLRLDGEIAEHWIDEKGHRIEEGEGKKEVTVSLSPSIKNGYPKVALEEDGDRVNSSRISGNGEISIGSAETDKRFRYKTVEENTEEIKIFNLYPDTPRQGTQRNRKIALEINENYPVLKTPWSVFNPENKSRFEKGGIHIGEETFVSFVLDTEFMKHSEPASVNRVAGLDDEKKRLKDFLSSDTEEKWGLQEERGIVLEGPPGTGKTELTIEVCQEEYGKVPVLISGPEILSKWVGESERLLRQKFHEAWNREKGQGRVIYIDELDAIARAREESAQDYSAQIVSQLLVLLDGVEAKQQDPFKVVASTNLAHVVDPALRRPGRLGERAIRFELPDPEVRKAILHHYLQKIYKKNKEKGRARLTDNLERFVKEGASGQQMENLLEKTVDFSGADLEDLIITTVKQLSKGRELTVEKLIENTKKFEKGSFGLSSEPICTENPDDEIKSRLKGKIKENNPPLIRVEGDESEEQVKKIASAYFDLQKGSRACRWRKLTLPSILGSDEIQTKENIINAFEHSEEERICVYFPDFERLRESKEESRVLRRVWGIIHEKFLGWDQENILIIKSSEESSLPNVITLQPVLQD